MARSASDNSEGLTFTGADIWVPRGPISRNEQFGIPTGYYSAVLRATTGTVSNGGGRPAPSRWARTTRTTSCALPRRLPPMHILNSTASDFQTHRTLRAGPAPRMLPWPPSRDLAAPAPAGSLGQHESHADAPMRRISCRGGLPPPCTALRPASWLQPSGAAARISPRRSPNPASVDALLSSRERCHISAQSTSTAPAAVSASWPCALERRSRGASSWPHTARGFGALSL